MAVAFLHVTRWDHDSSQSRFGNLASSAGEHPKANALIIDANSKFLEGSYSNLFYFSLVVEMKSRKCVGQII